ncbi:MAG: hypothetical protein RJA59_1369 [Pseudomonadota bacterium]|jgi:hypothetical protein
MNTAYVVLLLVTAAFGFSGGWFLACIALSQSHMRQAKDLDAERQALDEEREMLTQYWKLDQPPVKWALGEHKRIRVTQ